MSPSNGVVLSPYMSPVYSSWKEPVHYWSFDEDNGAYLAFDYGNGTVLYDGYLSPEVTRNQHLISSSNKGYISMQSSGYVEFDPNVMALGTNPFTFSLWMRKNVDRTLANCIADVIGNRNSTYSNSLLAVLEWGALSVSLIEDEEGQCMQSIVSQRRGLDDTQWHFYTIVRNDLWLSIYVDGVFSGSAITNNGRAVDLVAGKPFRVGGLIDHFTLPLADYDELMMFDVALSSADIMNLYDSVSLLSSYHSIVFFSVFNKPKQQQSKSVFTENRPVYPQGFPLHYWSFDEASGTTAYDSGISFTHYDGALSSGVLWQSYGGASGSNTGFIRLPGQTYEHIDFSPDTIAIGTQPFTIVFQMRKLNSNQVDVIGNRDTVGHSYWLGFRASFSGTLIVEIDQNAYGYIRIESVFNGMNDGNWHHYCVVRDGAQLTLYVDGIQDSVADPYYLDGGVASLVSGAPFRIGLSLFGDASWFAPMMDFDELMIFDYALSSSTVQDIFNSVSD